MNKKISYIIATALLTLFLIVSNNWLFAQTNFDKGRYLYDLNKYGEAIPYFQKASESSSENEEIEMLDYLADCYRLTGNFEEAENIFKQLVKIKKKSPASIFDYAQSLKTSAKYAEAKASFIEYSKLLPSDPRGLRNAESCDSAEKWLLMPIEYEVRELTYANSEESEFSPIPYSGGIVYTTTRSYGLKPYFSFDGGLTEPMLDLYYIQFDGTDQETMDQPYLFPDINSNGNDGTASFTSDGKEVYFSRTVKSTARNSAKSDGEEKNEEIVLNTLQIYYSRLNENHWSKPVSALSFNSDKYSVFHPCISADGEQLFFASDMPGGLGGSDIYVCHKVNDGWSKPVNLGPEVNTYDQEVYPYICKDKKSLYFSSNGLSGMGNLDVFNATFDFDKGWTHVVNMRAPINSIGDDFAFVIDTLNERGLFTSNRIGGAGDDDIYTFHRITPVEFNFNGNTISIKDHTLYDGIKVKIKTSEESGESAEMPLKNGNFISEINNVSEYIISLRKDGFLYNKIEMRVEDFNDETHIYINPQLYSIKFNGLALKPDPNKMDVQKMEQDIVYDQYKDPVSQADVNASEKQSLRDKFLYKNQREHTANMNDIFANNTTNTYIDPAILNHSPVYNASVKLLKNKRAIDQKYADADGAYSFTLPEGEKYEIIIRHHESDVVTEQEYPTEETLSSDNDTISLQKLLLGYDSTRLHMEKDGKPISLIDLLKANQSDKIDQTFASAGISLEDIYTGNNIDLLKLYMWDKDLSFNQILFNNAASIKFYLDNKVVSLNKLVFDQDHDILFEYLQKNKKRIEDVFYVVPQFGLSKDELVSQENMVTIEGGVLSKTTAIANAKVQVFNNEILVAETYTNIKGNFSMQVPPSAEAYNVVISKYPYYDYNTLVVADGKTSKKYTVQANMEEKQVISSVGVVKDGDNISENTKIDLYREGQLIDQTISDKDGQFKLTLREDEKYNVSALKPGYFRKDVEVSTVGKKPEMIPMIMNVEIEELMLNKKVQVVIYFDFSKARITPQAAVELDKLAEFIKLNKIIALIEFGAHTDEKGDEEFNMALSQKRAQAAADYLIHKGISRNRIKVVGFGETQPIVKNAVTEEDNQKNRRAEFRILKLKIEE